MTCPRCRKGGRCLRCIEADKLTARSHFDAIHGEIYLWRIGKLTAECALEGIDEWMRSVESGPDGCPSGPRERLAKPSSRASGSEGSNPSPSACEYVPADKRGLATVEGAKLQVAVPSGFGVHPSRASAPFDSFARRHRRGEAAQTTSETGC